MGTKKGEFATPPFIFLSNIYCYNTTILNNGINEQNRLIDTLKRLMGDYTSKPTMSYSNKVKEYLNLKFGKLTMVPNQESTIYFVDSDGKSPLAYSKKEGIIKVPSSVMIGVMEMFGIEEDFIEEIFKEWVKEKYDLPVQFVDYY